MILSHRGSEGNSSNVSEYVKLSMFVANTIEDRDSYQTADSESHSKDLEDTHPAFDFIFAIRPRDRAPPALHQVGCHIKLSESDISPDLINKLALFTQRSAAPLVCVEITFEDYEKLKTQWVWAHPSINATPPNIPIVYILICCRTNTNNVFLHIPLAHEEGDCLQIDTTTLEPIGTSQFSLLF